MISKRHRSVRQSLIFIFTNVLLIAGLIFTVEIILILLGIGDITIPLTHKIINFITNAVF